MTDKRIDTPGSEDRAVKMTDEELWKAITSYYDNWSKEGRDRFLRDLQSYTPDDVEIPF